MAAVDLLMSLKGSSEAGAVEAFKLGPADPNVPADAQSMSLAKSYGEKYPAAPSATHLEWLVFFEHELMRHAARAENQRNGRRIPEVRSSTTSEGGRAPARGGLRARGDRGVTFT